MQAYRAELRDLVARYGVLHPRVFGSAIRGGDTAESDLDLLVDPTPFTTLMTLAPVQLEARRLLGVRVDVLTAHQYEARQKTRRFPADRSGKIVSSHSEQGRS